MSIKELTYAARTLRKSPVFTVTAVVTIALGIGASTAIFSVMNAVLLRPLPYRNADRLVFAISEMRKRNVKDFPISNADFLDLRTGTTRVFDSLGAVSTGRAVVPRDDGSPEQIRFAAVSTNFLTMFGAALVAGREFNEADGQPQPAPPPGVNAGAAQPPQLPVSVILSYEYWRRRFGASTAVIGQALPGAQQKGTQIVGVLAPGFELLFPTDTNVERLPDVYFAARLNYDTANRNDVQWRAVGKLKENARLEQAQEACELVSAELRKNSLIQRTADMHFRLEPMHQHVVEAVRPAIVALMGAVTFLLLIACANVANLLLVRLSLRERELAVRTALGGSWWRLVRQMLTEALVLASVGAVLGVGLAWLGIHELRAIAPANLPRLESIAVDPSALIFAAVAALVAASIFGIVPAIKAARPDVAQVLRASGRTGGLGGGRVLRNAVVIAEVALSFVLLVGSGLMIRSFVELQRIDPGFNPRGLLTFQILGGGAGRTQPQQRAALQHEIESRLRALRGVQSVTASFPFPLAGGFSPIRWGLEPALSDPSRFQAVDFQIVLPGYFDTLQTPLIEGRTFTEADNAPERSLVVVDQQLAAKAFPKQSAVGKRILIRIRGPQPEWVEIIGVVAHQRQTTLAEAGREQIYFMDGFLGHGVAGQWAVRTSGDPAQLGSAVRAEISSFDRNLMVADMTTMDDLVRLAGAGTRFTLLLIGVFACIAAILAAVGLYGVLATVVRQRTAEIGVRMALGAAPKAISQLVVGQGLRLSLAGIGAGMLAAAGLTRVMASMLIGVKATDPFTFGAMALLFLMIAFLASWLPARRAAGLDPSAALRGE